MDSLTVAEQNMFLRKVVRTKRKHSLLLLLLKVNFASFLKNRQADGLQTVKEETKPASRQLRMGWKSFQLKLVKLVGLKTMWQKLKEEMGKT